VSRATEVYSREFDSIIFKLAPPVRELSETEIHDLGSRLGEYPHHRLTADFSLLSLPVAPSCSPSDEPDVVGHVAAFLTRRTFSGRGSEDGSRPPRFVYTSLIVVTMSILVPSILLFRFVAG
jgi:hypothetical protein